VATRLWGQSYEATLITAWFFVSHYLLYFSGKMHVETACSFCRLTGLLTTCSLCACVVHRMTEQFSTVHVCIYRSPEWI